MQTKGWFKMVMMVMPLFIMVSCQVETFLGDDTLSQSALTGKWEWVRTDGGIGYHIHETPATTGRKEEWIFLKGMNYQKYVNGVLTSEGSYLLEKRDCIHSEEDKWLIDFSSSSDSDMMIENVDTGFLELSDELYDGIGHQFKRSGRR